MKTRWLPIGINQAIKLGFPPFKIYYDNPLFLKMKKDNTPDKRLFLTCGLHDIPKNGVILSLPVEL